MRLILSLSLAFIFSASSVFALDVSKESLDKNEADKISYIMGADMGTWLKKVPTEINFEVFYKGVRDTYGDTALYTPGEIKQFKIDYYQKQKDKLLQENIAKGEEFLSKNKKRKGIATTDSGLQFEVVEKGTGKKPKATDTVKVHYKGTLLDGTIFDSSYERGKAVTFPLNQVIKGWTEGVQLMKVGAKYKFYIPYNLAYGEQGAGGMIGPGETLIFDVKLISIEE